MQIVEPEVGCWYTSVQNRLQFEVVAIDDDDETIEIQYFDGDIEELERDNWYQLSPKMIPAPEDWSGPYEMEPDELNKEITMHPENWSVLSDFDPNDEI